VQRLIPGPSALQGRMVYDPSRSRCVLLALRTPAPYPSHETWEYDGAAWVLRTAGGLNGSTSLHLAFDTARDVGVVLGAPPIVWEWRGGASGDPPWIVQQPTSQFVLPGGGASLTVVAQGTAPLAYQWRRDSVPLANGGSVSGATSPTLHHRSRAGLRFRLVQRGGEQRLRVQPERDSDRDPPDQPVLRQLRPELAGAVPERAGPLVLPEPLRLRRHLLQLRPEHHQPRPEHPGLHLLHQLVLGRVLGRRKRNERPHAGVWPVIRRTTCACH
jgi:hypothetical protein